MPLSTRIAILILLLLGLSMRIPPAFSYVFTGDYLPGSPKTFGRPFKMTCITADASQGDFSKMPANVQCHLEDGILHFSGRTKNDKKWDMRAPIGLGCSLWKADLDGNGHDDILALFSTGACGIAPNRFITSVLFDEHLIPHVYEVEGYFENKSHDVEDLRKFKAHKGAVLVVQTLVNYKSNNYWLTSAYECRNSNWVKLTEMNGLNFPAYTLYSVKIPNHKTARKRIHINQTEGLMKDRTKYYVRLQPAGMQDSK